MTHSKAERIGILTSGGDCPGLNAVIRGTYKAARQLGYEVIGFQRGYEAWSTRSAMCIWTIKAPQVFSFKVARYSAPRTKVVSQPYR